MCNFRKKLPNTWKLASGNFVVLRVCTLHFQHKTMQESILQGSHTWHIGLASRPIGNPYMFDCIYSTFDTNLGKELNLQIICKGIFASALIDTSLLGTFLCMLLIARVLFASVSINGLTGKSFSQMFS